MFFDDGVRRIDYILAWEVPEKKEEEDRNQAKAKKARETFEENLIKEGLELERDLVRDWCFCYFIIIEFEKYATAGNEQNMKVFMPLNGRHTVSTPSVHPECPSLHSHCVLSISLILFEVGIIKWCLDASWCCGVSHTNFVSL